MHYIESRIEFPDPILMTLDTSHGPITKFLKKCGKNEGKNYFFPILVFESEAPTLCMEMWTFPFIYR